MTIDTIHLGDALEVLKSMPTDSVDCCVTSPPYYGLRNYGAKGQIGLEPCVTDYINRLVDVFHEVRRVLKSTGSLWLNIGDCYAGSGKGAAVYPANAAKYKQGTNKGMLGKDDLTKVSFDFVKRKELVGVPWKLAFALSADGWFLRQDIIWNKPNCMPESVKDRCTKSHEYIFLLSKSPRYFFDAEAIAEPVAESSIKRYQQNIEAQKGSFRAVGKTNGPIKACKPRYGGNKYTASPDKFYRTKSGSLYDFRPKRNKRSVWTVSTQGYKGAHFATFPEKLIEPCILAGCPVGGVVLDPFIGTGTTAAVAKKHHRHFVGIEISPNNIQLARDRLGDYT